MKTTLTDEEFVRLWMTARTFDDVAAGAGVKRQSATVRAAKLRKIGVRLPRFKRRSGAGHPTRDCVDKLNAIIAKLEKK